MSKPDISKLTKEEKLALYDALQEKKRRQRLSQSKYEPNDGQLPVHESEAMIRIVASGNGCWAKGTPIRMFDGTTKFVEEVMIGDELMGPDNTPRKVLKLYEGVEPMYKIIPAQSDPYIVNESHNLSLYKYGHGHYKEIEYCEVTVKDYLNWSDNQKRITYQWRPSDGIEYPEKDLPIDPYLFGVWLGDGTSNELAITTMDSEILDYCKSMLGTYTAARTAGKATTYRWGYNSNRDKFKPYFNNKHVPDIYKIASREQRLQLLAGFIDTDGHLANNQYYEIVQKRENLIDAFREIAQSLGFKASKRVKYIQGIPYYRMNIIGPIDSIPVKIPYKKASNYNRQRAHWRETFTIEPVGEGLFVGFQVDGDNLLLMADYTVQRNSGKTLAAIHEAIWHAQGWNPITKQYNKVPTDVIVLLDQARKSDLIWKRELLKWFEIDEKQLRRNGKPYLDEIVFKNGSTIKFFSQETDILTLEGIQGYSLVVADEPPPEWQFNALFRGAREKGKKPKFLIIGTPIGPNATWIRKIWENWSRGDEPDVECFRTSAHVNRHNLSEGFIEKFEARLSPEERAIRIEGAFSDLEGLALSHLFKRDIHVISGLHHNWDVNNPCVIGIDPHTSKPHTAVLLGCDRDNYLYVLDEIHEKSLARDFAKKIKRWMREYRVIDIVADCSGQAEMTSGEGYKSFIEVLRDEENIPVRPTKKDDKSDETFITRIQEILALPVKEDLFGRRIPKLRVYGKCRGTISNIENVTWQRDKRLGINKPKLDIREMDFLAALKYALSCNLVSHRTRNRVVKYAGAKKRSY